MLQGLFGLAAFAAVTCLLSENRRAINWRVGLIAIALQFGLAILLVYAPGARNAFAVLNDAVLALQAATEAGSSFVFGYLAGGPTPFETTDVGANFVLALRSLPLILVVSALTAVLTYWRILPWIVRGFGLALERLLRIGGAASLATAANIFVGMVEAPLFVRPYLARLTRSELFIVMTAGMATIAGTVLVVYATLLQGTVENPIGHLLIASLISAPAAVGIAMVMVPETQARTDSEWMPEPGARSVMDAITNGTQAGLTLVLQVAAMLLVLVALVALVNSGLSLLPDVGGAPITLERTLGYLMAPVCWCMGIPWSEAVSAGQLMGIKTVLNEFIAFVAFTEVPAGTFSEQSHLILIYALCGFANFGSLGIMIGGFTAMVPERRDEVIALGLRSIVAGTLATCMTGCVIGLIT